MGKVTVQMTDRMISAKKLLGQVARLKQMFEGRLSARSAVASDRRCQGLAVAFRLFDGTENIGPDQAGQLEEQLGGQVVDAGLDLFDRLVTEIFSAFAHWKEPHGKTKSLQQQNLVGDKSL